MLRCISNVHCAMLFNSVDSVVNLMKCHTCVFCWCWQKKNRYNFQNCQWENFQIVTQIRSNLIWWLFLFMNSDDWDMCHTEADSIGISWDETTLSNHRISRRSLSIIKSSENRIRMLKSLYVIHFMQLHICCDLLLNGCVSPKTSEERKKTPIQLLIIEFLFTFHLQHIKWAVQHYSKNQWTIHNFIFTARTRTHIYSFRFTFNLNERDISSCQRE